MALEIMKNIADAEQKGDAIRTNALAQAEQMSLDADNKCKQIFVDAQKQSKMTATKLIEDAVSQAQTQMNTILSDADNSCEVIKGNASHKMTQAVDAIVRKVVGANGNS